MIRITHSVIFFVGLAIAFLGPAFSYSAGLDDTPTALILRGDGSIDDDQQDRLLSEMKRRGEDSSEDKSEDRGLEENRSRSHRNRGRDDQGILTRDDDHR